MSSYALSKSKSEHCCSDAVFHIELQPTKTSNASERPNEGSDDVIMRNSVHPLETRHHDVKPKSAGGKDNKHLQQNGEDGINDSSDGPDVFTEEPYAQLVSTNQYQIRKMASQTLMDVALMMANISQLRTVISLGPPYVQYYVVLVTLVITSLACQLVFAIIMFIIWVRECDQHHKHDFATNLKELETTKGIKVSSSERLRRSLVNRHEDFNHNLVTNRLNYVTMILVFFITVTNMFITGFGIKTSMKPPTVP